MKTYRFSLLLGLFLLASTPFHMQAEKFIFRMKWEKILPFAFLAILVFLILIALWRVFSRKKMSELTLLWFSVLMITFFLFQKRIFASRLQFSVFLHLVELFALGWVVAKENRKNFSLLPLLIVLSIAVGLEAVQLLLPHRIFDWKDIWINVLSGFSGLSIGLL